MSKTLNSSHELHFFHDVVRCGKEKTNSFIIFKLKFF